jgi:serine/threonine-protein kinase
LARDDWDEIYARPLTGRGPEDKGMHASTVFLIAFFTSVLTASGTAYVFERFDVLGKTQQPTPETVVPDLRGFTEADARANTQSSDLALLVASREPSPGAKPGTVIRQSIPAGQRVPHQHPVSVVLADELPKVPALKGLTVVDATKKVEELGFKLVTGESVPDATIPVGQILDQDPEPDAAVEKGKSVTVKLSAGPGEVEVPKIMGLGIGAAKAELEKVGLELAVRWVSLAETPTSIVLNQKPRPKDKAKPGTKIEGTVNRP